MYVTDPNTLYNSVPVQQAACKPKRPLVREVKAGAYLFREADEATRIYKVISGVLRLSRIQENGRRQIIAFGYPGDVVGFPVNGEHTTDCKALSDAFLTSYRREDLENGADDPDLHQELLQAALSEISDMQDHFMMLGQKSASEKIASLLCALADRVGEPIGQYVEFTLPMSRCDIADFLGLTTETVSRCLTQLRKCKIIAVSKIHTVVILQPDALAALAEGND